MSIVSNISKRFVDVYYDLYAKRAVKSKKEFCDSVGIYYTNFWSIEQEKRDVTLEQVALLAETHNISLEWLFFGNGDMYRKSSETIVDFSSINKVIAEKYIYNRHFNPEKLTDANLEKCVYYYSEKLKKNTK